MSLRSVVRLLVPVAAMMLAPFVAAGPEETDTAESHWSFQPVQRSTPPEIPQEDRDARNPVDQFIRARLAEEGLVPSDPADRRTLIRRLTFDVIGLAPTPEEVDAFVSDDRPDAYERLVERLLASSRFGERWARHWLDLARYAETHGFEMNNPRPNAWRYRDYVIRAFNEDKPFDQFVMDQLAGDSVNAPEATGFLVAGPWDQVKSPDEVLTRNQRADELHDMINATSTAFLGLTVACARCHKHKFDPISQADYFRFKAMLDGVQHGERELPSRDAPARARDIAEMTSELRGVEASLIALEPTAVVASDVKEPSVAPRRASVNRGINVDRFQPVEAAFLRFTITATSDAEPCIDELEVWTTGGANVALAERGARATASGTYPNSEIHRLEHINDGRYGNSRSWISNERGRGWVQLEFTAPHLIDRVLWSRDRSPEAVYSDRLAVGYRIAVSRDGMAWTEVANDSDRRKRLPNAEAVAAQEGEPSPDEVERRALQERKRQLEQRLTALRTGTKAYAGTFMEPEPTRRWHRGDPMQPREEVEPGFLSFEAFKEGTEPVSPGAPERERRLALAKWIASDKNPLTARVIVNRIWQHHFGEGLVSTPSDFGLKGARPTHPELLDWLASELMHPAASDVRPWSLKHIHRLILTSATYRQSSKTSDSHEPGVKEAVRRATMVDAGSRLLWRYPSRRLEAEPLRDAMLEIAGRLDLRMGGPGWSPFEPNENYVRVYNPKQEFGPDDFRRMVYATVVRQRPEGVFGVFDCPDGGQTAPARTRSITPLQALNLLNSGFMLQVSKMFASRLEAEAGSDPDSQARRAFLLAFQRAPEPGELEAAAGFIREEGLMLFCRAMLNANEFAFVF